MELWGLVEAEEHRVWNTEGSYRGWGWNTGKGLENSSLLHHNLQYTCPPL